MASSVARPIGQNLAVAAWVAADRSASRATLGGRRNNWDTKTRWTGLPRRRSVLLPVRSCRWDMKTGCHIAVFPGKVQNDEAGRGTRVCHLGKVSYGNNKQP
jgi:hypothetical protein